MNQDQDSVFMIFEKRLNELRKLTSDEIDLLWHKNNSLSMGEFVNIQWRVDAVKGWTYINICTGNIDNSVFKVFFNHLDTYDDARRIRCEKIAIILACEMNVPRKITSADPNKTPATTEAVFNAMMPRSIRYNTPDHPKYIKDYSELHKLCCEQKLMHKVIFDPQQNFWEIEIAYYGTTCFRTGFRLLSEVIMASRNYIYTVKPEPEDHYPNWPDANDLAE